MPVADNIPSNRLCQVGLQMKWSLFPPGSPGEKYVDNIIYHYLKADYNYH